MAAAAKKTAAKRATGKGRTSTRKTTGGNRAQARPTRTHNDLIVGGRNGLALAPHKEQEDNKK